MDNMSDRVLLMNLLEMFPNCPAEYLIYKSKELINKPEDQEQLISNLLMNDSRPPQNWEEEIRREPRGPTVIPTAGSKIRKITESLRRPEVVVVDEPRPGPSNVGYNNNVNMEDDWVTEKQTLLTSIFPKIDPHFLYLKVNEFLLNHNGLNQWINDNMENSSLPTKQDYIKKQELYDLKMKYSRELSAQEMLNLYGEENPIEYFNNINRKVSILYQQHCLAHLKRDFPYVPTSIIMQAYSSSNYLYVPSLKKLRNLQISNNQKLKRKRSYPDSNFPQVLDINFLKELQFSKKEDELRKLKENKLKDRQQRMNDARKNGLLMECQVCFSDDILLEEIIMCQSGNHNFCFDCVKRGSHTAIGDSKTEVNCFAEGCEANFDINDLKLILNPTVFSKWLTKIQEAEIEEAEIEGLSRCPFCPFATIIDAPPEINKIFVCQNPECLKESCRLCGEISHIPKRCNEIEKNAQVVKRTFIENKMSEALIRFCHKCKKPFIKEGGCNFMRCSCGATSCYICREPNINHNHFFKMKCAEYDTKQIVQDISEAGISAKREMNLMQPNVELKYDPTNNMNEGIYTEDFSEDDE